MIRRTFTLVLGLSASLFAAQGALAAQDPAFGYDPFHQFGYERPVANVSTAPSGMFKSTPPQIAGQEVDYVYGSDARMIKKPGMPQTALQLRDALGRQSGA
jgi:hypothetical protein